MKLRKQNKFYALLYYKPTTNEEIRIAVDKSRDYLRKLLDVFCAKGNKKKSSFRIVEFTSKKNSCLQFVIDDFLLEV